MLPNSKRIVNRIDDISEKFFAYSPPLRRQKRGCGRKTRVNVPADERTKRTARKSKARGRARETKKQCARRAGIKRTKSYNDRAGNAKQARGKRKKRCEDGNEKTPAEGRFCHKSFVTFCAHSSLCRNYLMHGGRGALFSRAFDKRR